MNAAKPYILATLGVGLLTGMDGVVKELMLNLPFIQAVFLRFAAGSMVALGVLAAMRPAMPDATSIRANLLRVPLVVLTASTFFLSVRELPLAEAIALSFLSPIFVAILGLVMLKERVDRRIIMALGFGLAGMMVMLAPKLAEGGSGSTLGVMVALAAAMFYALNLILLRKIAQRDPPPVIVAFQSVGPALVLAIPAIMVWQPLSTRHLVLSMCAGLLAVAGHLLITRAYALANAARVAPSEYSALIWAALIGFMLFGEVPGLYTFLGTALIVFGAMAVAL
jgi:drug/metabolite transporter (DMT)-like permease